MTVATQEPRRVLLQVSGIVQGVGFRPFVHRLATRMRLGGWVRNTAGTVEIALVGDPDAIAGFNEALAAEAPPLARIESVRVLPLSEPVTGGFAITPSAPPRDAPQPVPADVALCDACEAELRDPGGRRYAYPFIACTDCGPRFSVIEAMPYDRERTTLRAFPLCDACAAEYRSPADRRFHAEATACPVCGPRARLTDRRGVTLATRGDAIAAAASLLRSSQIAAVRGVGGFHLAADATDERVLARLRQRKRREAKPLAVMVRSLDEAGALVLLSDEEREWLQRPERPIVVARRRPDSPLALGVSGSLDTVGVMLAYAPLHLLLCEATRLPLVMTSGNTSDLPLVSDEDEARESLGDIADAFLTHDREIANAIDDSVVRLAGATPIVMRRARGFAPVPVPLPVATPTPLLAVGAHLKNTFALASGAAAYVSQHVGDLETLETAEHWERMLRRYEALFHVTPDLVVRDRHPEYLSSVLAERMGIPRVMTVQHHHAHVAAVAAEHGITKQVVGIALDGVGYGDDGCIWGAELMLASLTDARRIGHLRYAPLPGGDAGSRAPWRAAIGYMSLEPDAFPGTAFRFAGVDDRAREVALTQARRGLNAPLASSMGRLFDAAAALLGICLASRFEGEAAMLLEAAAGRRGGGLPLPFPLREQGGELILDPIPLLGALANARAEGRDRDDLAAGFHNAIAGGLSRAATRIAQSSGVSEVALGGGVFQNARLLDAMKTRLEARGLRVLVARQLPPNDGGISYGQAAIAAARLAGGL